MNIFLVHNGCVYLYCRADIHKCVCVCVCVGVCGCGMGVLFVCNSIRPTTMQTFVFCLRAITRVGRIRLSFIITIIIIAC